MAKADTKTAVVEGGLRYKSKPSGSPYAEVSSFGGSTMSCYMCGKHRARASLQMKRLLGKSQAVCSPSCKALDEAIKG